MSAQMNRNQRGQMTIEAVLIMVALMSVVMFASQAARQNNLLQNAAAGPWKYMRGMIEDGIWSTQLHNPYHPNVKARHATAVSTGDDES